MNPAPETDGDLLAQRVSAITPLAMAVRVALMDELLKVGFVPGTVPIGDPGMATYRLDPDAVSGGFSLVGEWRDARGAKQGNLVFHADGTFFVEYDVVRPHPRDRRWFVEAVNAWGKDWDIRAEPRLLPVLG